MHDCKYTENTISFFLNYESFRVIGFNSGFYLFRQRSIYRKLSANNGIFGDDKNQHLR